MNTPSPRHPLHAAGPRPARPVRRWAVALGAVAAVLALTGLSACGGADDDASAPAGSADAAPAPGEASATAALEAGATVIDVRTPEEYAAGHVEGARLIDVQSESFDDEVATLDPELTYVVYCRSGNRSAQAAGRMAAAGFTVLDGGALDDMTAAGWPESTA